MTRSHHDTKWACLWDFLHVKTGTQLICGLAFLKHTFSVILLFALKRDESFWKYEQIIEFVIGTLAFIGVLVAIEQTQPQYFFLCLGFLAVKIVILSLIIFCFSIFYLAGMQQPPATGDPNKGAIYDHLLVGHHLLWCFVILVFNICVFDIVYECYKFVLDKAANKVILPQSSPIPAPLIRENKCAAVLAIK